jgi:D-glycero-D-manno-heptose 1,7-bisphosphate phosphatase
VSGTRPAAFVDRDGVVNRLVPDRALGTSESPYRAEDVALAAGAVDGLRALRGAGYFLICVSNQPAAAKGLVDAADLKRIHERVVALLAQQRVELDDWRYCFHHPDASDPAMRACNCRKPLPGMLLEAASEHGLALEQSWMIGDSDSDVAAGEAAGCRTALVENPDSAHRRTGAAKADLQGPDLASLALEIASGPR